MPAKISHKFFSLFFLWRLSKKPMHGYALLSELDESIQEKLRPASVYAILTKLEKKGLISGKKTLVENRSRKVFHTTEKGKKLFLEIKKRHMKGPFREFHRALAR